MLISLVASCVLLLGSPASPPDPAIEIVLALTEDGEATDRWLAILRKRLTDPEYRSLASIRKPLTSAEAKWASLIRSRRERWKNERGPVAVPFHPIHPPEPILIVMGNRGATDAFTHDPTTMGFDLSALQSAYGDASGHENVDRLDRFFRHEYTHLLQKAWLLDHPYPTESPLRSALLGIWLEGLGNYYSLSSSWRSSQGESVRASAALGRLEPRFASRLSSLACASDEEARALTRDLSNGPFDRKWGALTVALWLEAEAGDPGEALRDFVVAGPDGVWDLASRHLPESLALVVSEARLSSRLCSRP